MWVYSYDLEKTKEWRQTSWYKVTVGVHAPRTMTPLCLLVIVYFRLFLFKWNVGVKEEGSRRVGEVLELG